MNPAIETLNNLPPANIDGAETSGVTYYGEAPSGTSIDSPGWRIWQKTVTSNLKEVQLPQDSNGTIRFDFVFVWSKRASYTYGR